MNNVFISYDLHAPVKNYDRVIAALKSMGAVPVLKSMWYIKTRQSSEAVAKAVWAAMDADDSLVVVDATNNTANWYKLNDATARWLQNNWR